MEIRHLRGLIIGLNLESHYRSLIGSPGFENAFDECQAIGDKIHATEGVLRLRLRYLADGANCTFREWLCRKQAAMILATGLTETAADKMPVAEFAEKMDAAADSKADSSKKLPTSERVLRAIKFVNDYNKRVSQGKADGIPENAILSMHLDKPVENKEVKNLARQLRNYRHLIRNPADS